MQVPMEDDVLRDDLRNKIIDGQVAHYSGGCQLMERLAHVNVEPPFKNYINVLIVGCI